MRETTTQETELRCECGAPAQCRSGWDGRARCFACHFQAIDTAQPPASEPATHRHRCMRCNEEFDCQTPGICRAQYDVMPTIVTMGPDGPVLTEHCPRADVEDVPIGKHGPYGTHTNLDGSPVLTAPAPTAPPARPGAGGGADVLRCPECGAAANRPKCMWELGPECPRHEVVAAPPAPAPAGEADPPCPATRCPDAAYCAQHGCMGVDWSTPAPAPAAGAAEESPALLAALAIADEGRDEWCQRIAKLIRVHLAVQDAPGAADARAREVGEDWPVDVERTVLLQAARAMCPFCRQGWPTATAPSEVTATYRYRAGDHFCPDGATVECAAAPIHALLAKVPPAARRAAGEGGDHA